MFKILLHLLLLVILYEKTNGVCNTLCKPRAEIADGCLKNGKAFLPPDDTFNCCGECVKVKAVISRKYVKRCGNSARCAKKKCYPTDVENCENGFVYVPADGKCFCCSRCVRRSNWD